MAYSPFDGIAEFFGLGPENKPESRGWEGQVADGSGMLGASPGGGILGSGYNTLFGPSQQQRSDILAREKHNASKGETERERKAQAEIIQRVHELRASNPDATPEQLQPIIFKDPVISRNILRVSPADQLKVIKEVIGSTIPPPPELKQMPPGHMVQGFDPRTSQPVGDPTRNPTAAEQYDKSILALPPEQRRILQEQQLAKRAAQGTAKERATKFLVENGVIDQTTAAKIVAGTNRVFADPEGGGLLVYDTATRSSQLIEPNRVPVDVFEAFGIPRPGSGLPGANPAPPGMPNAGVSPAPGGGPGAPALPPGGGAPAPGLPPAGGPFSPPPGVSVMPPLGQPGMATPPAPGMGPPAGGGTPPPAVVPIPRPPPVPPPTVPVNQPAPAERPVDPDEPAGTRLGYLARPSMMIYGGTPLNTIVQNIGAVVGNIPSYAETGAEQAKRANALQAYNNAVQRIQQSPRFRGQWDVMKGNLINTQGMINSPEHNAIKLGFTRAWAERQLLDVEATLNEKGTLSSRKERQDARAEARILRDIIQSIPPEADLKAEVELFRQGRGGTSLDDVRRAIPSPGDVRGAVDQSLGGGAPAPDVKGLLDHELAERYKKVRGSGTAEEKALFEEGKRRRALELKGGKR